MPKGVRLIGVVYSHPRWGLIYPYQEKDQSWWVIGGQTRVPASGRYRAEQIARDLDRTGDCPVPKSQRVTPRGA